MNNNSSNNKIEVEAIKLGINGEGISFRNQKTIFIPYLLPKEVAEVEVIESKGNFVRAKIAKITVKSDKRINPKCNMFGLCGGCTLQHLEYFEQLKQKRGIIFDSLNRYLKSNTKIEVRKTIPLNEEYHYRNKAQMPVENKDGKMVAGFYKTNTNHLLKVENCPIQIDQINSLINFIVDKANSLKLKAYERKNKTNGLKHIIVRYSYYLKKAQVTLVISDSEVKSKFLKLIDIIKDNKYIDSINININDKSKTHDILGEEWEYIHGEIRLREKLEDIYFDLHPRSFFQLNTLQTIELYNLVKRTLNLKGTENVIDAYCGVGTISLWLAKHCKKVRGVDISKEAIIDAKHNAKINKIDNVHFENGNASNVIKKWIKKGFRPDVLVVDPSRVGLDNELLDLLLANPIKKIVYVSCNPSTLTKNLNVLKAKYNIKYIQPIDMFGQTSHIESVTLLTKR